MKKIFNVLIVGVVTFCFSAIYFLNPATQPQVNEFISLTLFKPYVYRALVPALARALIAVGVPNGLALVILMTCAGIGFYLALRELLFEHYKYEEYSNVIEIWVIVLVFAGEILFQNERMPYDLFTAWFWTLAMLYLYRDATYEYAILFPLICINRYETAAFLIPLYILRTWNQPTRTHKWMVIYQLWIWAVIEQTLHSIFADNGGLNAWIEPIQNLQRFANHPWHTGLHVAVGLILLFLILKDWYYKPGFARVVLMVLGPVFVIIYIIFGQAFEVRVFWEIFPAIAVLIFPTLLYAKTWLPNWILNIPHLDLGKQ